jgi:cell division protein FtsQ
MTPPEDRNATVRPPWAGDGAIVLPEADGPSEGIAAPPAPTAGAPTPSEGSGPAQLPPERAADNAEAPGPKGGWSRAQDDDPAEPAPHVADPAVRRRLAPWVIVVGCLLLLGGVALGASYTPMFAARTIRVIGDHHLSRAQVLKMAHVSEGANLLHTDLGAAERRLERDPWIEDVSITRRLPGTLNIDLTERVPAARIDLGSTFKLIAGDGTDLGPAVGADGLPLVQTLGSDQPPTGDALSAGAAVASALPAPLRPSVASVAVGGDGVILVVMRDGLTVTYGDASQPVAKGEALRAVLGYASERGLRMSFIDVTVPEAPTATLANGTAVVPAR